MKKSDLVDLVSQKNKIPKSQAQQVLEDVFDAVTEALARGEKIDLRGFGTFSVRNSEARSGRNPRTGDAIAIPARRVPGFRPGKELKERCNLAVSSPSHP